MPYNLEGAKGAYCWVFTMYIYLFLYIYYLFVGMFGFTIQSVIASLRSSFILYAWNSMCCLHDRVQSGWKSLLQPIVVYHLATAINRKNSQLVMRALTLILQLNKKCTLCLECDMVFIRYSTQVFASVLAASSHCLLVITMTRITLSRAFAINVAIECRPIVRIVDTHNWSYTL